MENLTNLGLFVVLKTVSEYAESMYTYSENMQKGSKRSWRGHKETVGVFS
jgi:hypothetical protein